MPPLPRNTLYLVDSSIYVFRAWHTLPDSITSPEGHPLNALYGFADFLAQLTQQSKPRHLVCAFDKSLRTSARNKIYPPYKANRATAPDELKHQFALCQQLAELCGYRQFSDEQFEADDIIGTLALLANEQDFSSCIISADKDLAQFISEPDLYWNFQRKERLNYKAITKKFGVRPDQIADQLAISGDKVDNIPGVPGVGMATAAKLLAKWNTLDELFNNVAKVAEMKFRGAARVAELLAQHESDVRLARKLTGLFHVDDLPTHIDEFEKSAPDEVKFTSFLEQLGFSDRRRDRLLDSFLI